MSNTPEAAEDIDPVTASLNSLSTMVTSIEKNAREANAQVGYFIRRAGTEIGLGGLTLTGLIFSNLHLIEVGDVAPVRFALSCVAITALAFGVESAWRIPASVRRARTLLEDSRCLRSSLTAALQNAINAAPYRALELPDSTRGQLPNKELK